MKYFVIFLFVLFSGCLSFCMNSTENRQSFQLMINVDDAFTLLKKEANSGNITSSIACQIYSDCIKGFIPYHLGNKDACNRLIVLGLCKMVNGKMIPIEYYIDDRLPKLERHAHLPRKFKS